MHGALENVIVAALDELEQGQTVEEILDRYPQKKAELRPILETASGLTALESTPSPESRNASRQAFLAEAARLRESSPAGDRSMPRWRRIFYSFASFALFLLLLGVIVIPPSADAIPGDILYPVKRSAESAQLLLASPAEEETLRAEYEEERNREVYQMLEIGRDGRAGYIGIVKEITAEHWKIGNITAHIEESTVITGEPEVGARVEAHCLVQDREVIAETLTVLEPADRLLPADSTR